MLPLTYLVFHCSNTKYHASPKFFPTLISGFLWEEIKEMHKDGMGKYFRNMWNILDVMRDTLYISTMFLRIFAFVQQSMEIKADPQVGSVPNTIDLLVDVFHTS